MPNVILSLVAFIAAQETQTEPVLDQRLVLWQSLREGMSADEVAVLMRAVDGVKAVVVKTSKSGKSFKITYKPEGVVVGGLTQTITPTFKNDKLATVSLRSNSCLSLAIEKYKNLRDRLTEKYGDSKTQREVTEDRSLVAMRDTFKSTPTRVMLRLEPGELPQHIYPSGGSVAKLMAEIANSSTDAQIEECPKDSGQKALIEINYLNNQAESAVDIENNAIKQKTNNEDRGKL